MRSLFSLLGLVLVVAVIGMIASRQLSGLHAAPGGPPASGSAAGNSVSPTTAAQVPAQYKKALDAALQTARPMEGDAK